MLPFKKILFPVDYSPSCIAMVPYVSDMVRHFSAELLVIHAYALRPMFVNHDLEGSMVYADLAYTMLPLRVMMEIRRINA